MTKFVGCLDHDQCNTPELATRRIGPALAGLLILLTSCGVSRTTSEETLTEEAPAAADAADSSADDASEEATSDDQTDATTPTTVAAEPTPTPSTAPGDEIALDVDFGDETWQLTHGQLNDIAIPTWENQDFVTRAFGGQVPPNFYAGVANEFLIGKIFDREVAKLGGSVAAADEQQAKDGLLGIMQGWFPESADPAADAQSLFDEVPYLGFLVDLQSTQAALTTALVDSGELAIEAPCVRHILVEEEPLALEVLDLLNAGGDFAQLAAEHSTGPSGPDGGDLGCSPSSGYVPEFAAAVDSAVIGAFVGPVQTEFGWHVLVVERFGESQANPEEAINTRIGDALGALAIDVDPRIGVWDDAGFSIVATSSE